MIAFLDIRHRNFRKRIRGMPVANSFLILVNPLTSNIGRRQLTSTSTLLSSFQPRPHNGRAGVGRQMLHPGAVLPGHGRAARYGPLPMQGKEDELLHAGPVGADRLPLHPRVALHRIGGLVLLLPERFQPLADDRD